MSHDIVGSPGAAQGIQISNKKAWGVFVDLQCHLEGYKQLRRQSDGACLGSPCFFNKLSKCCSLGLSFQTNWKLHSTVLCGKKI